MIADLLFSVGVTVGVIVALAIAVYLFLGVRYIPHRRVGIIEKLWSASGSPTGNLQGKSGGLAESDPVGVVAGHDGSSLEAGAVSENRRRCLQSFGDIVYAFAEAMNHGRPARVPTPWPLPVLAEAECSPTRNNLHHAEDVVVTPVASERGPALTSSNVR